MNESGNKNSVAEALVALAVLFLVLIFVLYKFGATHEVVNNSSIESPTLTREELKTQLEDQLENPSSDSPLYNKYLKQIYELQTAKGKDADINPVVDSLQKEIEEKVVIPEQKADLKFVETKFERKNYTNNFELLYQDFRKKGGADESKMFSAQIDPDGNLLPLSDLDRENVFLYGDEYENLARKMENLPTPKPLENTAKNMIVSLRKISFILHQMSQEKDSQIYLLWINKYSENMFDIIAIRYALAQ